MVCHKNYTIYVSLPYSQPEHGYVKRNKKANNVHGNRFLPPLVTFRQTQDWTSFKSYDLKEKRTVL